MPNKTNGKKVRSIDLNEDSSPLSNRLTGNSLLWFVGVQEGKKAALRKVLLYSVRKL